MERYLVHCRFNNIVEQYQNIIEDIAQKFGVTRTVERAFKPHITIKYGFKTDKINEMDDALEELCKKSKKAPITVSGVNTFTHGKKSGCPYKTVFLEVNLSDDAKKIFSDFTGELKKLSWLEGQWSTNDDGIITDCDKIHTHLTLAEGCRDETEKILVYVTEKHISLDTWFDNFTILKRCGEKDYLDQVNYDTKKFNIYDVHKAHIIGQ